MLTLRWKWNHWKVKCTLMELFTLHVSYRCHKHEHIMEHRGSVRMQCMINHSNDVNFRFRPWCHPSCSAGGCTDLCPAGRSNMVCVQEECIMFSGASHFWHRLLQTNQHTLYRLGWKRADHRPGVSLGAVALSDSNFILPCSLSISHQFTIRYMNATWLYKAVTLTPQDGGEMMTANMSFSDLKMRLKDLYHTYTLFKS